MYRPLHQRNAAAYRQVGVETSVHAANPHQLVELLFDELTRCINAARSAMDRGDPAAKGIAIGKSVRVLEEGLKAGLNLQEGGALAATLRNLYDGVIVRLTLANLRNDRKMLDEASDLIAPVSQAWHEIRPGVPAPSQAQH